MDIAPLCFVSQKQYDLWREADKHTGSGDKANRYGACTDCTPDYQKKMVACGHCAHPEAEFTIDEHGFVRGSFPRPKFAA